MRIPSGKTDQVIYFVAVDSTDLKTRETGLSSFTVYRSRNGAAAAIYTTPTVAELSAANMPGVYSLLIDEDTTVGASSDSEEYVVHITQAAMAPVTRSIELYRRDTTSGTTITTANIDDTISSRMATYTQPTGFLAATFPATVASTTNITAGVITTVTNLTNLPAITANWLTAAGTAADFTTEIQAGLATSAALGTAQSDISAILVDTAEIGLAGAGLTNINLPNQIMDITGNITGNLSGTVGSVTGAVGSVTGNVGGNVVGTVASVVGAVGSVTGNVGGNVVGSVASVTAAVAITSNVKKNQALAKFEFLMTDSTTHAPSTGLTVTVTRSIDGAAFGAGTLSAVTEVANGIYYVDFASGDLNGNVITLQATAAASDTTMCTIVTQP